MLDVIRVATDEAIRFGIDRVTGVQFSVQGEL